MYRTQDFVFRVQGPELSCLYYPLLAERLVDPPTVAKIFPDNVPLVKGAHPKMGHDPETGHKETPQSYWDN